MTRVGKKGAGRNRSACGDDQTRHCAADGNSKRSIGEIKMRTPQESQDEVVLDKYIAAVEKEINKLRQEIKKRDDLLERALPKVMDRKYARALDKKDYSEEVQWQKDYKELMGQ